MIAKIRTFLTRGLLALCLASGLTAQTIEPAAAAPIAGMTSSPEAATANPVQQAYYYRYYRVHHRRPRRGGTIARFIAIGRSITCLAAVLSAGTNPATAWYSDRIGAATADLNPEQPMNLPVRLCSVKRSYGV